MKTYKKLFISCLVVIAFFALAVGNANALNLSQTSITVSQGQTQTIYASNYSTYLYVSNNSNNSIANISISGSVISIYGSSVGSTTATMCDNSSSSNCMSIYITVNSNGYNNGNYNNGSLGLNISNMILSLGSSATISSNNSNYSGPGLYVSNNSNPSVASVASSSPILGCTSASLYSVVTGQPCNNNSYYNNNYNTSYIPGCYAGALYSTTTGQSCNYNNSYNGNSNGSIVITAVSAGSDTITLCLNGGGNVCSTISVTVNGYATPTNYSYYYSVPTSYSNNYNNSSYYNYDTSYIPGCYAGALYSTTTGQSCNNNYNNYNYQSSDYYNSQPSYDNSGIPIIYSTSSAYQY